MTTPSNAAKTHCKHGHEFTPENTAIGARADGGTRRVCRACTRERYHDRQRGATHCRQGHERTPENILTYQRGDGRTQTVCRECQRLRSQQQRRNRKRPVRMPDHCQRGHKLNERTVYVSPLAEDSPTRWECCLCLREDMWRLHYRLPRTEPVPAEILAQVGAVQVRGSMAEPEVAACA